MDQNPYEAPQLTLPPAAKSQKRAIGNIVLCFGGCLVTAGLLLYYSFPWVFSSVGITDERLHGVPFVIGVMTSLIGAVLRDERPSRQRNTQPSRSFQE